MGDAGACRNDTMISQHGNALVFQGTRQPVTFGDISRKSIIRIIIGNLIVEL